MANPYSKPGSILQTMVCINRRHIEKCTLCAMNSHTARHITVSLFVYVFFLIWQIVSNNIRNKSKYKIWNEQWLSRQWIHTLHGTVCHWHTCNYHFTLQVPPGQLGTNTQWWDVLSPMDRVCIVCLFVCLFVCFCVCCAMERVSIGLPSIPA